VPSGFPIRLALLALVLVPPVARADDQPFLTLDATDIEPESGHELEQNFGWNHGLAGRAYSGFEGETEWEYGYDDRLQLAVATAYGWSRTHPHLFPAIPAEGHGEWSGIEGEAIYQAMNVYFDPIGLGFKFHAAAGPAERSFAATILLQKNFFNDRLRLVTNIGGEVGRAKDGAWSDTSALTVDAGAAYNITWSWSAALEFNAERDYSAILFGGRDAATTSYYAGPTLQYVAHPWTASLGVQAQLPWSHDVSAPTSQAFVADAPRWRIGLRVTRDFY